MIDRPVVLGYTPTSCTPMGVGAWSVTATIDDPLEINDGWAIAVGDVVFLDHRLTTTPPSASRYEVSSLSVKSSRAVSMILEWACAAAPVSPAECLGVRGYLAQPVDAVGTVQHPIPQAILLDAAFIDLAKKVQLYAIGDESSESEQVRAYPMGEAVTVGQFVHVTPAGLVVAAIPQDAERMPAAGLVLAVDGTLARVQVSGIAPRIASGLVPGAPVFVGEGGLPVSDPAGITLPAAVQVTGVALDSSSVALSITGQLVKRA